MNDRHTPIAEEAASDGSVEVKGISLGDRRAIVQQHAGQLALAMAKLARYKRLPISDFDHLVLQPLLRNRVVFFRDKDGSDAPEGIAIWASVADSVSERIARECAEGIFPVRLVADEWASGDHVWLLDVVVPNRRAGSALFHAFGQITVGRSFRMHPIVLTSVEPELVERLREAVESISTVRSPQNIDQAG